MQANAERIRKDALTLPLAERAALADELLSSLDRPEPTVDALWAKEAGDRLAEFDEGRMEAFAAADVFAEFERP